MPEYWFSGTRRKLKRKIMAATRRVRAHNRQLPKEERLGTKFRVKRCRGKFKVTSKEWKRADKKFNRDNTRYPEFLRAFARSASLGFIPAAISREMVAKARSGKRIVVSTGKIVAEFKPLSVEPRNTVLMQVTNTPDKLFMIMPEPADAERISLARSNQDFFDDLPTNVAYALISEKEGNVVLKIVKYFYRTENYSGQRIITRSQHGRYYNSRKKLLAKIFEHYSGKKSILVDKEVWGHSKNKENLIRELDEIAGSLGLRKRQLDEKECKDLGLEGQGIIFERA